MDLLRNNVFGIVSRQVPNMLVKPLKALTVDGYLSPNVLTSNLLSLINIY